MRHENGYDWAILTLRDGREISLGSALANSAEDGSVSIAVAADVFGEIIPTEEMVSLKIGGTRIALQ